MEGDSDKVPLHPLKMSLGTKWKGEGAHTLQARMALTVWDQFTVIYYWILTPPHTNTIEAGLLVLKGEDQTNVDYSILLGGEHLAITEMEERQLPSNHPGYS